MSKLPCLVNLTEQFRSSAGDHQSTREPELLLPLNSVAGGSDAVSARRPHRVTSASDSRLDSVTQEENDWVVDSWMALSAPGVVGVSHQDDHAADRTIVPQFASAAATSISTGRFSTLVSDRVSCANDENAISSEGDASSMHELWGYYGDLFCAVDGDCSAAADRGCGVCGTRKNSKWNGESLCRGEMTAVAPQVGASCSTSSRVLNGDVRYRDCFEPSHVVAAACCENFNIKLCEKPKDDERNKDEEYYAGESNNERGGWQSQAAQVDDRCLSTAGATAAHRLAATDWPLTYLESAFSQGTGLKGLLLCQRLDKRVTENAKQVRQHQKAVPLWPQSCSLPPSRGIQIPDSVVQQNREQLLAHSWPHVERPDRECVTLMERGTLRADSVPELGAHQSFLKCSSNGSGGIGLKDFGLELDALALPTKLPLSAQTSQLSQPLPHCPVAERLPEIFEAEIWKFVDNMQAYRDLVISEVDGQTKQLGDSKYRSHANVNLLPRQVRVIGCSSCLCSHGSSCTSESVSMSSQTRMAAAAAAAQVGVIGHDDRLSSTDSSGGGSCFDEDSNDKGDGMGDALLLPDELWLHVFSYLSPAELCRGPAAVCRRWHRLCADASLWTTLEFSLGSPIASHKLCYVASRAPRLRTLSLQGREQLLPTELAVIGQLCPSLVELDLGFCNVGLAAMVAMANCGGYRCLSSLNVEGSGSVSADFLQQLCSLPALTVINLSHCHMVTDLEMIYLARHVTALTELNADGLSFITDEAVEELVRCHGQRLTSLHLDGADLTDVSLRIVSWSCPRLAHLRVSFCEQLTDESLQSVQNLMSLKSLGLRKGSLFSSAALQMMFGSNFRMSQLLYLDLSECTNLDDVALQSVARCCPRLKELHLRWCWEVSEVGLEAVVNNCRSLRVLDLLGIDKITGNCFRNLPSLLPVLRQLDLSQCNRILDEIIQDVVKRAPSVQVKNYYGELFKA